MCVRVCVRVVFLMDNFNLSISCMLLFIQHTLSDRFFFYMYILYKYMYADGCNIETGRVLTLNQITIYVEI